MIRIIKTALPTGVASQTDGIRTIWVADWLNATQEWCAIVHETVHIEMGHTKKQPEHIEMEVRYETARRLLPDELQGKCQGSTLREVADNFGVTPRVLMDRAASAPEWLADAGGCASCQLCPAMKARYGGVKPVGECVIVPALMAGVEMAGAR
jgi:hypothetical protein